MTSQFEAYLQYVCAGIRSHRKREEIHDELLAHLEDNYERARATGRTAEEAENDAIENMGDREVLRGKFMLLYKFSPPEYMRSTINCVIFGLMFIFLRLEITPLADRFLPLLGQILLLCALFRLHRYNKSLKIAAGIFLAYLLTKNIAWFITVYDMPQNLWRGCFSVAAAVFVNLFCCVLYVGIQNLCDKHCANNSVLYLCILPQCWVAYYTIALSWDSTPYPITELASYNFVILIGLIFPLVGLWRIKKALSCAEPEFPLEQPLNKTKRKLLAVCVVLCLLLPLASMVAAATRAPKTESYTVADTAYSADADETRTHLRALGLPEDILRDLPDSEVLHYRTAQYMESELLYTFYGQVTEFTAYVFYLNGLPEEDVTDTYARKYLRVLVVGEGFDERAVRFRDGIYATYQDDTLFHDSTLANADFFLLLAEKDGSTVSAQPFSRWQDAHSNGPMSFTGYDFTFPHNAENRRMYFASTALLNGISDDYTFVNWSLQYYRQVLPLNIVYRCNHERADDAYTNIYHPWDYEVDTQSAWFSIEIAPEKFTGKTT